MMHICLDFLLEEVKSTGTFLCGGYWKERYACITPEGMLAIFNSMDISNSNKPLSLIPLKGTYVESLCDKSDYSVFSFRIVTSWGKYIFACSSVQSLEMWLEALCKDIYRCNNLQTDPLLRELEDAGLRINKSSTVFLKLEKKLPRRVRFNMEFTVVPSSESEQHIESNSSI
jgi:hypothetical protein